MTEARLTPTEAKCPPIAISCDWGNRSTNNYTPKIFCAGRDRILLRLAWPKPKCPPNEFYLPLARTKQQWRRLKQSVRRSQLLVTEVNPLRLTTHRQVFAPGVTEYFCDWRDRSVSFRRPKFICDWRDRSKNDRRLKPKSLPTAIACDWGDRSTIDHPPKSFRARRDKIFCDWRDRNTSDRRPMFVCDWRKRSICDRQPKLFLCLTLPKAFASGAAEAQVSADRSFLWLRWPQHG